MQVLFIATARCGGFAPPLPSYTAGVRLTVNPNAFIIR
jgi:hypothetical protein